MRTDNLPGKIKSHPIAFLFILFLMLTGVISGLATHMNTPPESGGGYIFGAVGMSVLPALAISLFKNTVLFLSAILCAVWIPGVLPLSVMLAADGFIWGFTAYALVSYSFWRGLLHLTVSLFLPNTVILYGILSLSIISVREWATRLKGFALGKKAAPVSAAYMPSLPALVGVFALGVFLEGVLSPLIMNLLV